MPKWIYHVFYRWLSIFKYFKLTSTRVYLEKALAPHSSTLAWKIPWTGEPGRQQSMGLQRLGHNWATSLSLFTFIHWRRKWQPTPVFLPGESQGWGTWWAAVYQVAQSQTRLKQLSSSSSRIYHSPRGNYPKKWLDLFKYTFTLITYPRKANVIHGYTKIASEWLPTYCVGWVNLTIILLWELIFFYWALAEMYLSEWVISYIPRLFNSSFVS